MSDMLRNAHAVEDFESGPGPAAPPVRAGVTRIDRAIPVQSDAEVWLSRMIEIRDNRSEAAFVALFRHFAPRIKAFLMRQGTDPATAEEIVQEAMSSVWHKAHLFDPSRASVATWVFTIARNRRIDHARKAQRPEPEDLPWGPDAPASSDEIVGFQQDSARLGEALRTLPDKQRHLIEKAYFGDLSHSEIAAETGLPLGTIKSRIRLALDRLRHAMT